MAHCNLRSNGHAARGSGAAVGIHEPSGLWKGDLTLKRAIVDSLETLAREGEVAKIIARYTGDGRTAQRRGMPDLLLASSAENNP